MHVLSWLKGDGPITMNVAMSVLKDSAELQTELKEDWFCALGSKFAHQHNL
jgi:hypothetical protein